MIEKRFFFNEQSISQLWDNLKGYNICVVEVPEFWGGGGQKKRAKTVEEKRAKIFPNVMETVSHESKKHNGSQAQEA